ncbi:TPA: hypothetical protein U2M54_003984 [Providencia rettgeri]|uniref:hypothetical protein n=1 Tax=Providencia rettgeri TaxID=587 RepID=UPI00226EE007|nr:hypothetical protein [Providencia rettgeri]MCX9111268.1 hypothetical protein [Providencia rettgeri]HEM8341834.1 hypothetical protein [Providencia rettgeri]
MGFGDFLAKAAKLAGKAVVAVASEVVNQGGTTITKNYLEKVKNLNLNSRQREMILQAEKLNSRLSDQKRNQKNISNDIKNNELKLSVLKKTLEEKADEVWCVSSKLINDDDFYKICSFNKEKFIVFSDEKNTKISLIDFINELISIKLDGNTVDKEFLEYINNTIPNKKINNIYDGFFDELIPIVEEYKILNENNNKEVKAILADTYSLEGNLSDIKDKITDIDEELKPLLNDIKDFCRPLIEEQKSRSRQ